MTARLVLASATSPTEQETFEQLVLDGVDAEQLPSYLPTPGGEIQHAWPIPADAGFAADELSAGDIVLFYRGGNRYEWAAEVTGVTTDPDGNSGLSHQLAEHVATRGSSQIDPHTEFGESVLLLATPFQIELESFEFHDRIGVSSDSLTRSVMPAAESVDSIAQDYGSIAQFLSSIRTAPSVFAELSSVSDKPYKQPDGEYPLGSAVFSRQEASDGSDRYATMEEPQVGDFVLHLLKDSQELRGVSVVTSTLQTDFGGPPDDSWPVEARGDGYYLPLAQYHGFTEPIDIKAAVFQNELYRGMLETIRDEYAHLPYDKRGHFVQGYLFRVPQPLLYLILAEEPELLGVLEQNHWAIERPGPVQAYDSVSEAAADVRTRLPFTTVGREWLADHLVGAVLDDITQALTGLEPNATVTQSEKLQCELLSELYGHNSGTLADVANDLGVGELNQVEPSGVLFIALVRELQAKHGLTVNMNQVKFRTLRDETYEVEVSAPEFDVEESDEPLAEAPEPTDGAEIRRQLEQTGQMVFYGPPGTGKTYTAQQFVRWWLNEQESEPTTAQLTTVTFHPSFSYEDFIEGLSASNDDDGNLQYNEEPGVFKQVADRARQAYYAAGDDETPQKYVVIVDEINRGNLAQIFGETITALEYDKRTGEENETKVSLAHSGDPFTIPPNLYLIGTMNTADRSIALVDAALRRRFRFLSFPPELEAVAQDRGLGSWSDVEAAADGGNPEERLLAKSLLAIEVLNARIREEPDLGRGKQIGHSFFYDPTTRQELVDTWRFEILPLFEEYYFGQYERIRSSLFDGEGDALFDWEREQIMSFDADALEATLEPIVDAFPPGE